MLNSKWIRSLNLVIPVVTAIMLFGIFGDSFKSTTNIFNTGLLLGIVVAFLNIILAIINYRYKY